ncbi:MAG: release factor glutamine methyltransferase [Patiriisocius sp.]|jgi:release factor glutamine methyltransferase
MFVTDNRLSTCKQYVVEKMLAAGYEQNEAKSVFEVLAGYLLKKTKVQLLIEPHSLLSESELLSFNTAAKRLINGEPIQHITQEQEFYGRDFYVNSNVLIPRPETEELVRWILDDNKEDEAINILDIGTGSACIAITLDRELHNAKVTALDVSEEALTVAQKNNVVLQADVNFIKEDILNADVELEKYDVIVSNPPYVKLSESEHIESKVKVYEPDLALFVEDNDPLIFYRAISLFAKRSLKGNGKLYFEINQYLGKETKELLESHGFRNIELRKDLNNNDRMIRAEL